MAVVVVEEPEVVDVDQRDTDAALRQAGRLHLLREKRDDRAVVQHVRQRVAACRLDQLDVLTAEARLRRSEDEEEHGRQEQAGGERDDHDVPSCRIQARQERRCIAPHGDHRDRVVPPSTIGRYSWRTLVAPIEPTDSISPSASTTVALGRPSSASAIAAEWRAISPTAASASLARTLPSRARSLDAEDLVVTGEAGEEAAQLCGPSRAGAVRVEVRRSEVSVTNSSTRTHRG